MKNNDNQTTVTTEMAIMPKVNTNAPGSESGTITPVSQPISPREFNHLFFDPLYDSETGAFQSPLCGIGDILRRQGLSEPGLTAAMLTHLVIISARLGLSLAIILSADNPFLPADIIEQVKTLAPDNYFCEFNPLSTDDFFIQDIDRKTIICPSPSGIKKAAGELSMILKQGYLSVQERIKSKYGNSFQSHKRLLTLSFIGISLPSNLNPMFHDPIILRVPIASENLTGTALVPFLEASEGIVDNPLLDLARIKAGFGRLSPCTVNIPYAGPLSAAMDSLPGDLLERQNKAQIIAKLIRLITIVNNPPSFSQEEFLARMYNLATPPLIGSYQGRNVMPPGLTATKIDYYFVYQLLKDVLGHHGKTLALLQRQIFDAIKAYNWGRIGQAFIEKDDNGKILPIIATHHTYWANMEYLFGVVNHDEQRVSSMGVMESNLKALIDAGVIGEGKDPQTKQTGYFIKALEITRSFALPHPSEIIDPVYHGDKVKVINPLTGREEEV